MAARMEARFAAGTESDARGHAGDLCEFTEPHLKQIVQSDEKGDGVEYEEADWDEDEDVFAGPAWRSFIVLAAAKNAASALNPQGRVRVRTRYVQRT